MANTMITSGQKEGVVNDAVSAARKAIEEGVDELSSSGVLHAGNQQRVRAQGDKLGAAVKAAIKKALAELAEDIIGCLKRIFADCTVELVETDGTDTLADATDVFTGGIYGATRRKKLCAPTKKTLIAIYEMILDATFRTIFGGFGENLKRLAWQESQIVAFCRDHRNLLRTDGYGTFFLFEGENGGFFVANVNFDDNGQLKVNVNPLDNDNVWNAEYRHRIVVPKLAVSPLPKTGEFSFLSLFSNRRAYDRFLLSLSII